MRSNRSTLRQQQKVSMEQFEAITEHKNIKQLH